jgi:hypothetical protein
MACTDAEDEFADTLGDLVALWVGTLGLVIATGLGMVVIGLSLVS